MTTIIDKETNQEFEILGNGYLGKPTHYITIRGDIVPAGFSGISPVMMLSIINKQHTFGDLVLEETGEYRTPEQGEWYLSGAGDIYPVWNPQVPEKSTLEETYTHRLILRHVCGGEV